MDTTPPTLSIDEAYQAMRAFLDAYWHRGAGRSDDLAVLLSGLQGGAAQTADPAMWGDWLDAVKRATQKPH